MSSEIKVVISLKDSRGSVGVQAPGCDPILTTLEGDLGVALERVPDLVQQAQDKWAESARYPKADVPKPPPPPPGQAPSSQIQRSTQTQTPRMF